MLMSWTPHVSCTLLHGHVTRAQIATCPMCSDFGCGAGLDADGKGRAAQLHHQTRIQYGSRSLAQRRTQLRCKEATTPRVTRVCVFAHAPQQYQSQNTYR